MTTRTQPLAAVPDQVNQQGGTNPALLLLIAFTALSLGDALSNGFYRTDALWLMVGGTGLLVT